MNDTTKLAEPTEAELEKARAELAVWQTPAEFEGRVRDLAVLIRSATLFNKPNVKFLLDAVPLAEFCQHRKTQRIRLAGAKEQFPDGYVDDPEVYVEVTEVLEEGRRRGQEYLDNENGKPDGGVEHWRENALAIPDRLKLAIEKKIEKKYAVKPILLVYLNMSTYGILQKETEVSIQSLKQKYASSFKDIQILWANKLY